MNFEIFRIGFLPISLFDILDILVVSYIFYALYKYFQNTRAGQMLVGLVILLVMTLVARNYPNPFNPKTTIYFQLAKAGRVSLKIYDVRGRLVRTLVDEHRKPGYYEETWAGKDDRGHGMASSVYLYRFLADGIEQSYKMVLIK